MRLHNKNTYTKAYDTMFEVRLSHALIALPFIVVLLFFGSYKRFRITLIPLQTSVVALFSPYCFSRLFHYIFIEYKQSNALPSTLPLCE